ncbi:phosphotransferase family protein [Amycolatopsis sp. VS8301801F10]|uniref:phosphotransferase family protein n=1 Tax=Amycolatopsis sp. VS8301801F10 TaxID=2652442 RepID=UPI0038FCB5EA
MIADVLGEAGVRQAEWTPLTGATFNTAYRVRPPELVVKVSPPPDAPALTYERGLLRTEARFYELAAAAVPVPRVVHTDFSGRLVDGDVLVMTELPGDSWATRRLPPAERAARRTELGGLVAGLHRITGTGFGYPGRLSPSWRTAFTAMLAAVLADAERFAVALPLDQIRTTLLARTGVLSAVRTPVLVHFDLWQGNILLGDSGITGFVDGERAFWGDPLADLVSTALFGDIERDADFCRGYRDAGGDLVFDDAVRVRLALYRCYLYLIMLVETVPRGCGAPAAIQLATAHLRRALAFLGRFS